MRLDLLLTIVLSLRIDGAKLSKRQLSLPVPSVETDSLRKIVPKSIFIAPQISRCPQGYTDDGFGVCFRLIQISELAYWNNMVIRLNEMYDAAMRTEAPQQRTYSPDDYFTSGDTENDAIEVEVRSIKATNKDEPLRIDIPITSRGRKLERNNIK